MTQSEKRNEWESRVDAFKASGQSTSEWCTAHNLKPYQLRSWIRKLHPRETTSAMPSQWLSVEVGDIERSYLESILLIRVGQATLEVKPGFDPTLLSDVVRTLSELC